jgi:hypothetical protein
MKWRELKTIHNKNFIICMYSPLAVTTIIIIEDDEMSV